MTVETQDVRVVQSPDGTWTEYTMKPGANPDDVYDDEVESSRVIAPVRPASWGVPYLRFEAKPVRPVKAESWSSSLERAQYVWEWEITAYIGGLETMVVLEAFDVFQLQRFLNHTQVYSQHTYDILGQKEVF